MKLGFIGCGNMGTAILSGVVKNKLFKPAEIIASAKSEETLSKLREIYKVNATLNNLEVASKAEILILGVKPHLYGTILNDIKDVISKDSIVVSIAAGVDIAFMENILSSSQKIVRTMPNTPVEVLEGVTAICYNQAVNNDDVLKINNIFNSIGICKVINEALMDSIPSISGSSPAYVFMFIEALAKGGIKQGLSADISYKFAAQSVLGAAKMVLETNISPDKLKNNVCSPGGATIEAVKTLKKLNFEETIISAMESCTKRAKELSDKEPIKTFVYSKSYLGNN